MSFTQIIGSAIRPYVGPYNILSTCFNSSFNSHNPSVNYTLSQQFCKEECQVLETLFARKWQSRDFHLLLSSQPTTRVSLLRVLFSILSFWGFLPFVVLLILQEKPVLEYTMHPHSVVVRHRITLWKIVSGILAHLSAQRTKGEGDLYLERDWYWHWWKI